MVDLALTATDPPMSRADKERVVCCMTGVIRTAVTPVTDSGAIPEADPAEPLLLAIYGCGTDTGLRAVASRPERPLPRRHPLRAPR